jgi:tetratricopeptide (TPR) repeat protein
VGLSLALATGTEALARRFGKLVWVLFGALCLANAAAVQVRNLDWRSAESLFLSGLDLVPDSALSQANAGIALVMRGDGPGAESATRRALALYPGYAEARSVLGSALELQGKNVEAESEYAAALRGRFSVEMAAPYVGFLLRQGRRDEALRIIDRAQREFPESARLRELRARATAPRGSGPP